MVENDSKVVNFTLSKDLNRLVSLRIHCLRGLTTSMLHDKIYSKTRPSAMESCTNFLIDNKLKNSLKETEIITEIHIESGIGKNMTVPVIIGLSSEVEREEVFIVKEDANGQTNYVDDTMVRFSPFSTRNSGFKSIHKNPSASDSSIISSSESSESNTISLTQDAAGWLELPIEYSKLPLDANLVITNWCYDAKSGDKILLNTGRVSLFDDNCTLNKGRLAIPLSDNSNSNYVVNSSWNMTHDILLERKFASSTRPPWLNKLAESKLRDLENENMYHSTNNKSISIEMVVELQNHEIPVIFSDIKYVPIQLPAYDPSNSIINYDQTFNEVTYTNNINKAAIEENSSLTFYNSFAPFDPDQIRDEQMEDPIEQKFRKLERMQHLSSLDKELKPTLKLRDILSSIMKKKFFEKLTAKERNMVWRYRWFILNTLITGNVPGWNNALINFIKCVDWNNESEVNEFESILTSIKNNLNLKSEVALRDFSSSPVGIFIDKLQIIDCLELLSSTYRNPIVRNMAVRRLEKSSDFELSMFLVQLVQSIKNEQQGNEFETNQQKDTYHKNLSVSVNHIDEEDTELQTQTNSKVANRSNYTIGSSEYQIVENEINNQGISIVRFIDELIKKPQLIKTVVEPSLSSAFINFLIERSVNNASLTNYFYWSLKVEIEEEKVKQQFENIDTTLADNTAWSGAVSNASTDLTIHESTMKLFIIRLARSSHGKLKLYELRRQIELVNKLHEFCFEIKVEHRKESTPMKLEILKAMLQEKHKRTVLGSKYESRNNILDDGRHETMMEFPKLAIPLDPTVYVNGTIVEESAVFKSSLNPLKITFKTTRGQKYPIMYKIGDDLRQDQFVIQLITLMENILESENMDLKLKPYKILATGTVEGFIQFIPNNSLSHILAKYNNSILLYLQTFNPDSQAHLGVDPDVMDTYVRSCAGYCVVTYLLGVGDRHLENLLLSKDGHFFHADFGYILGQDPKPFPPLMKLPIQIIEGMGGSDDINYKKFCQYCFITYITLRKNASLILNLVQLMINTSIPALRTGIENNEAEKMEILWKVEEKFMLDMNDEEAVLHFQNLIDSSVNAFLPVVIDRLHNLAQYWRS